MCVDVAHLVFESLRNADDQVVDEGADGAESCDVLPGAVVQLDIDDILLGVGKVDGQVVEILGEFACFPSMPALPPALQIWALRTSGTLDGDQSRLDGDLDCWAQCISRCSLCNAIFLLIFKFLPLLQPLSPSSSANVERAER